MSNNTTEWSAGLEEFPMKDFEFKVVTVNSHGEIIDRQFHTARQFIERLESSLSIEMVEIPDNMFQMGSPPGQGFYDELPRHNVKISTFLIGKYPVTQEQWNAVMGWLPPCRTKGSKHPVDRVSWNDAITFCEKLHMITGRNYRLPSEAEWEYACRAGTTSPFYFGETITTDLSNYVGEYIYQSEPKGIYRHGSTDVGSFPPNMFGIYDMHGNVWEWCADTWHDSYIGAPSDGSIWDGRNNYPHVLRGGCWHDPPNLCRSAARLQHAPDEGEDFFGFRVALTSLEQHPNLEFGHGSTRHNLYSQQIKLIMDRILSWLKPKNQG